MIQFIVERLILGFITVFFVSVLAFFIIQLPPGDFLSAYVAELSETGERVDQETISFLRDRYGLDEPFYVQYFKWISGVVQGDFGWSFEWGRPVSELIGERLALTMSVSVITILFTWLMAIPIGIISATFQYSWFDYLMTLIGFVGLGIPNFLLALILLWIGFSEFNTNLSGLFSFEYVDAPWSIDKVMDMLKHIWIPVIILGTGGAAGLIRTMRANLLDELHRPYVETARAKGVSETRLILKYPVRVALNPFVSQIGNILPNLISGATLVSIVLSLPTTGPMLYRALLSQDMYLAGSFLLMLSVLTVIGTLLSDIMLAWLDPRIRYS